MRMLLLIVAKSVGFGFHVANATMRSLTPQEQASTCYPTSPMLYSDACWGSPYMSGLPQSDMCRTQQSDPFFGCCDGIEFRSNYDVATFKYEHEFSHSKFFAKYISKYCDTNCKIDSNT